MLKNEITFPLLGNISYGKECFFYTDALCVLITNDYVVYYSLLKSIMEVVFVRIYLSNHELHRRILHALAHCPICTCTYGSLSIYQLIMNGL